jgi:hypothetical protein
MKMKNRHDVLLARIPPLLSQMLGLDHGELDASLEDDSGADIVARGDGRIFVIEFKGSSGAATVAAAASQAGELAHRVSRTAIPLVAVPFMGSAGRSACERADVGWLDLSGNARIIARGLRIIIDGQPNKYRRPGRPSNVFAPKSARIARWLLAHPGKSFSQRDIARATLMDEGFVSRIVSRLVSEGYIERDESSAVSVKDATLLLDAWRDAYRFSHHTFFRGTVAARSGEALLMMVAKAIQQHQLRYATTGLSAAWLMTHFAAFRTASIYLEAEPTDDFKADLGFREDDRGANLWLIVPDDEGVLQSGKVIEGISCVHPVQAYLDLAGHPERSAEAAEHLRAAVIDGRRDA